MILLLVATNFVAISKIALARAIHATLTESAFFYFDDLEASNVYSQSVVLIRSLQQHKIPGAICIDATRSQDEVSADAKSHLGPGDS